MGGTATFAGTTYQQRVLAYLSVHVLAQRRLLWFDTEDDTPETVSGETGGPGDDCRVVFRGATRAVEIQAKHGLSAGAELQTAIRTILDRLRNCDPSLRVVLAVDGRCSRKVLEVASDLERLRSGRLDPLRPETKVLLALATDAQHLLARIAIVVVDVERDDSPHTKEAIVRLEATLKDSTQAIAAWRILVEDAGTLCARRWSRIHKDLVDALESKRVGVKPLADEEHRSLDVCRDLLRGWHVEVARERLEAAAVGFSPAANADPRIRYRLLVLKATCDRMGGKFDSAIALARQALDIDPQGVDAFRAAGFASLHKGDLNAAQEYADRAVAAARFDPKAWSLKAQIDAAAGRPPTSPPEVIERSSDYRTVVANVARNRGDWTEVLAITAELLQTGERAPDVLLLRAEALGTQQQSTDGPAQAIELCSEIIDRVRNEDDPVLRRALSVRSALRFDSGDTAGAEADIARLDDISGETPESIQSAAAIKAKTGDLDGALRLLGDPLVESEPRLLAVRAQVRKQRGDEQGARRDARAAHQGLTPDSPAEIRLAVAEALLDAGDTAGCASILAEPAVARMTDPMRFVLLARVAFLEGRVDDGIRLYRSGADLRTTSKRGILVELAFRLKQAGRAGDAADTLQDFGRPALSVSELVLLAQCLFDANRVAAAQQVLELLAARGPLPAAALSLAYDIALLSENREIAIDHLRTLIGQGAVTVEARLELVRLLSESNLRDEARAECLAVFEVADLAPLVRIQAAYLLASLDGSRFALEAAFRGYREARHDFRAHEALIVISGRTKERPPEPEIVDAETYVRLRHEDEVREYTIFSSGPIDPTRGERTVDEARALGLWGKRVGESICLSGPFDPVEWTIEEILTAVHHGVQEVYSSYEKNFPGRTFLRSFPAPTGASVSELSPLIRTVSESAKREEELIRMYLQNGFPLGFMAWALSDSTAGVMAKLAARGDAPGVFIEYPDPVAQRKAVTIAKESSELVLTRSALQNAERFGLQVAVRDNFVLTAPRSMLVALEREAEDAVKLALTGRMALAQGETGLTAHHLEPEHPDLLAHRDRLAQLVRWVKTNVRVEPRPLEWLDAHPDRESPTLREKIGPDSWDAVELAHHTDRALYADDLGLRRFDHRGKIVKSFSTATMMLALHERDKVDDAKLYACLHGLILARQLYVPASVPLLIAAVSRLDDLGHTGVSTVFGALATVPSVREAASLAAKLFKRLVTSSVQLMPLRSAVRMSLDAMRPGWPVPLIAQQVRQASSSEFVLMPRQLREIDQVCGEFVHAG